MAATTASNGSQRRSTITVNEANQLKTGSGTLLSVTVWNVGTTATLDIYDHGSTTTNKIFEWVSADGKGTWLVNAAFAVGLRVVTGGTTPGVNVNWK